MIVKNTIKEAIKKIVNSGKAAGVVASSPDSIKYWIELGVKFITCHQTMILSEALGNFVNSFNKVVHNYFSCKS